MVTLMVTSYEIIRENGNSICNSYQINHENGNSITLFAYHEYISFILYSVAYSII